jgi:hypothetical protein
MVNTKRTEAIQLRATPIETIEENQDLEIGPLNSNGYLPVPTSSSNRQSRHSRTESGSSFKMFTHTFTPEEAGEEAKDVTGGDSKRLAAQVSLSSDVAILFRHDTNIHNAFLLGSTVLTNISGWSCHSWMVNGYISGNRKDCNKARETYHIKASI